MLTTSQALALAVRHHRAGELESAERLYRAVLRINPDQEAVHYNLGSVLQRNSRLDEAIECYRRALDLDPRDAMAHRALGAALKAQGNLNGAVECFHAAIVLRPEYAEAHNNLGNTLLEQGDVATAVENYQCAAIIRPDFPDFQFNLGNGLRLAGRLEDAEECFRRALEIRPRDVEGLNSLGITLFDQGRVETAMSCFEAAIQIQPDHARSHYNRALGWLVSEDWKRGWPEYEWRWKIRDAHPSPCDRPLWTGRNLPGKTLLLEAEQGLGDTIQFIRFAAIARQKVGRVVCRCQRPLLQLLEGVAGIDEVFADNDPPTNCDVWLPLMSLPMVLGSGIEDIPRAPYLVPLPRLVHRWNCELDGWNGFRIGIQWQGNPSHPKDRFRSFPLQLFKSFAGMQNVRLISLQKGAGSEQLNRVDFPVLDLGPRLDESAGAFIDTAAVLKSLDLVVTTDTSIGHLAGALGVPTWIPLSTVPEWRWFLDRNDSPWYPTVQLFRQTRRGDWDDVFERMRARLHQITLANTQPTHREAG